MKLSRVQEIALAVIVPPSLRETFVGDLLEERALVQAERGEGAAKRWLRSQILRAFPAMLRYRLTRGGALARRRWLVAAAFLAIAVLQSWDSGVHRSSPLVIGIVALAIGGIFGAGVLSTHAGSFAAASGIGLVLLVVARVISPTPLPELMIPIVITLPMFLQLRAQEPGKTTEPGEPGGTRAA